MDIQKRKTVKRNQ